MAHSKNIFVNRIKFFAALVFVYVVLFQFILPANAFLPKPALFVESFVYIWNDYQLLVASGYTVSIIYSSLIISYIIIFLLRGTLIRFLEEFRHIVFTFHLFRYVPLFILMVLFSYWFTISILAEFAFAVILTAFYFAGKMFAEIKNVKQEYVTVALNLGISKSKIYSEVYWKELQPKIFDPSTDGRFQLYLWFVVLVYEFINDAHGLGAAIRNAFYFHDYTALLYFVLITDLVIWCFAAVLKYIESKLIFWNN